MRLCRITAQRTTKIHEILRQGQEARNGFGTAAESKIDSVKRYIDPEATTSELSSIPRSSMATDSGVENVEASSFVPGDVVLTTSGAGVITRCPKNTSKTDGEETDASMESSSSSYQVLLNRVPGKSIGTASAADVQANTVSLSRIFHFLVFEQSCENHR